MLVREAIKLSVLWATRRTTLIFTIKIIIYNLVNVSTRFDTIWSIKVSSPLLLHHVLQTGDHLVRGQRAEPEPGAPGLKSRDDLRQVVTNQAETSVLCILLNHWKRERGGGGERGREREGAGGTHVRNQSNSQWRKITLRLRTQNEKALTLSKSSFKT